MRAVRRSRLDLGGIAVALTVILAIAGYPIFAPFLEIVSPTSSTASILLRASILAALIACAILVPQSRQNHRLKVVSIFYVFAALYTYRLIDNHYILGLQWAAQPEITLSFFVGVAMLGSFFCFRLAPTIDDQAFEKAMIAALAFFLVSLSFSWELVTAPLQNQSVEIQVDRASLIKLNPILLSWIASFFLLFLVVWTPRNMYLFLSRLLIAIPLILMIALSQSRGPLIGSALALVLLVCLRGGRARNGLLAAMITGIALVFAASIYVGVDLVEIGAQRFLYESFEDDRSALGRVIVWQASWEQFLANPLFGDRVYDPVLMHYPHNIFLESLISLGVVGTALLLVYFIVTLLNSYKLATYGQPGLFVTFALLLFWRECFQVQVSGAIWGNTAFWVLAAVINSLALAQRRHARPIQYWRPKPAHKTATELARR